MNSKEKLNSIESLINEFYHDMKCKGILSDCANECWKEYQQFCEDIKQDLERLEKLEEENASLHTKCESLHTKCESLQSENEIWKKAIENSNKAYDVLMQNSNIQFLNQNQEIFKLKKVIEILKSYDLKVEYVEGYYTQPIIKFNHTYNEGVVGITIEEFELLKEYLDD